MFKLVVWTNSASRIKGNNSVKVVLTCQHGQIQDIGWFITKENMIFEAVWLVLNDLSLCRSPPKYMWDGPFQTDTSGAGNDSTQAQRIKEVATADRGRRNASGKSGVYVGYRGLLGLYPSFNILSNNPGVTWGIYDKVLHLAVLRRN